MSSLSPQPSSASPTSTEEDDRGAARYNLLVSVLVIAAVLCAVLYHLAASRLGPKPTAAQCEELLDRYVDQASRARRSDIKPATIARAQQRARTDPRGLSGVQSCESKLTQAQVACALRAPNVDELERCTQ